MGHKVMLLGNRVCTCLLVTSLALSVDDERPLLLILHSPRGMVPSSPWSCRLAYTSVTLEN